MWAGLEGIVSSYGVDLNTVFLFVGAGHGAADRGAGHTDEPPAAAGGWGRGRATGRRGAPAPRPRGSCSHAAALLLIPYQGADAAERGVLMGRWCHFMARGNWETGFIYVLYL